MTSTDMVLLGLLIAVLGMVLGAVAGVLVAHHRIQPTAGPSTDMKLARAMAAFSHGIDSPGVADALDEIRRLLAWEGVALVDRYGTCTRYGIDPAVIDDTAVNSGPAARDAVEIHPGLVRMGLTVDDVAVATLFVAHSVVDRALLRTVREVAGFIETQLAAHALGEAKESKTRAQLLALKAQIRPHFIYNALNVIASFTITDPERARTLITEFAGFTRYWYSERGALTSLAEELRAIESYLVLERARYGDRLTVRVEVSPESLSTRIPHLSIQPLIENAVRHGIESGSGRGSVTLTIHDEGALTLIRVEDDGIGMDPDRLRAVLAGQLDGVHVGLRNVDLRLRETFGGAFGLVVDTAPDAGTLITVRVPKFALDPTL
ncbi:sensor histidine kinase [Rhodococcus sp. IEGM 248]|nr:sensor histidine kinase [Rhodococcus sp. IEGM 248]